MNELLPALLLGVVAVAFAAGSIGVSNLVGPRRPNPTKLGAYESGNEPLADVPGTRFSVKFYLVAMLFLIFDVEAVFVYPWAVVLRELGWAGLWQMVVFLGILGVAFVYEIGRGGLEQRSGRECLRRPHSRCPQPGNVRWPTGIRPQRRNRPESVSTMPTLERGNERDPVCRIATSSPTMLLSTRCPAWI